MKCEYRNCSNEVPESSWKNKRFCSLRCKRNERVMRVRVAYKRKAVDLLGGKCCRCGYNKCMRALQFHHVNPEEKEFGISVAGETRAWSRLEKELKKCILLCANCHAEEEEFLLVASKTGIASHC